MADTQYKGVPRLPHRYSDVHKILQRAMPRDLPVEQPMQCELGLNLTTA